MIPAQYKSQGFLVVLFLGSFLCGRGDAAGLIDLTGAVVVSPFAGVAQPEGEAVRLLVEEVARRTGTILPTSATWPSEGRSPIILFTSAQKISGWPKSYPSGKGDSLPENRPEGYRIVVETKMGSAPIVWAVGADARGVLFAAGGLLRALHMNHDGSIRVSPELHIATSPAYPLRGHQLGYRAKANTYDAWSPAVYEQHIRELIVFGSNAIEQIPFEDPQSSPHWPVSRDKMNVVLSEICARYGIEYWLWMPVMEHRDETPGALALTEEEEQRSLISAWDELFHRCPRIDGVFVPSGDPGMNKADLLMPFLERAAKVLRRSHPKAKVWVSHQRFGQEDLNFLYEYLAENKPGWFGGIAFGPWARTTLAETRTRLPKQYGIRSYPDITHTVRCQFPVLGWDRAFAHTLGREPINPRPVAQKIIHNTFALDTIGFLTYSDGVHDDVNKIVWSALGWDPEADIRDVLIEYGRYFVRDDLGEKIADGLLALEQNWVGPLETNGSVDGTLRSWQDMEQRAPDEAENNWRFQAGLFRAYYDTYVRHRLIHEQNLEQRVNEILSKAGDWDSWATMFRAERVLREADAERVCPELRDRIFHLADRMFDLIGHQTSVEKYGQSDYDRGTMIDTLDHPLNNRWWLEDQFKRIRDIAHEKQRLDALRAIPEYECPLPGTIYDDLGNIAQEPRLVRCDGWTMDPALRFTLSDGSQEWEPYLDRRRLSQQDGVGGFPRWTPGDWSMEMHYVTLSRESQYRFRVACRKSDSSEYAIFADDVELKPIGPPASLDEIEEYEIPADLTAKGTLRVRWSVKEGPGIHVTETWLIPG